MAITARNRLTGSFHQKRVRPCPEYAARRTGSSKRRGIELLQRLEERNLIRTDSGRGAVKWIRLFPLASPAAVGNFPEFTLTAKKKTNPGNEFLGPLTAGPKRRRKETVGNRTPT